MLLATFRIFYCAPNKFQECIYFCDLCTCECDDGGDSKTEQDIETDTMKHIYCV